MKALRAMKIKHNYSYDFGTPGKLLACIFYCFFESFFEKKNLRKNV